MPWLLPSFAFALGAIVGSFLNVVIHRYPREESIVFPASHCPNCNAPIKAYDNVPILSYL
ncbi:MAG TPA: prepilin peptidase, partial [Thermoanaerobaculia bacterium]